MNLASSSAFDDNEVECWDGDGGGDGDEKTPVELLRSMQDVKVIYIYLPCTTSFLCVNKGGSGCAVEETIEGDDSVQ